MKTHRKCVSRGCIHVAYKSHILRACNSSTKLHTNYATTQRAKIGVIISMSGRQFGGGAAAAAAGDCCRRFLLVGVLVVVLIAGDLRQHAVQCSGFGRCPKYPSMPKFNMTRFHGTWFELERSFYLPEIASSCTTLDFKDSTDDTGLDDNRLDISVKSINQWTGGASESRGHAITETTRSSIMDIQFETRLPSVIARFLPGAGRYQVLFTDYEQFSILWSCTSLAPLGHTDQIWLLGRKREDFQVEMRGRIHETLRRLGLDPDRLVLSKNKGCSDDAGV